jgi:putative hydrolase of the HAD superfamily
MIDWQRIDTVLLDLDGTLLDLHFDNHFWLEHVPLRWAERHGISHAEARDALHPRFLSVKGELPFYCLDHWSRELEFDIVAMKSELQHLIAVRPGVEVFLRWLGGRGIPRILATNAHHGTIELKMARTGLLPLLDSIYSAHDFGHPKEEQAYWQKLQQAVHFDPDRTLFVDDNDSVLDSARRFGIRELWSIDRPDSQQPARPHGSYPQVGDWRELITPDAG